MQRCGERKRTAGTTARAVLATVLGVFLASAGHAGAADRDYVALGDSVAAPTDSYVGQLFPQLQTPLGVTRLLNRAQGGATSESLRGHQLATALADINGPSDTAIVTIDIGGNDRGECEDQWDTCPFRDNFAATLDDLGDALAGDPGSEPLAVMAYYNPGVGTLQEADYDAALFGANGEVGLADTGADVGLNDVIHQEAAVRALPVADPYPAFKSAGQSYMADSLHPNAAGHAAIATTFCAALEVSCSTAPDESAPETTITKGVRARVTRRKVKVRFESSEPASSFECRLDRASYETCTSPARLKRLKPGRHRFNVRAIDSDGNVDRTPAKERFRVVR